MTKNIKTGKVILGFSLLKDATLGEMPVSDKLSVVKALGELRKKVGDFNTFKSDLMEKMADSSESDRMAAMMAQANSDTEIGGYDPIGTESFGMLIDANKKFTVDEMTVLQELLTE